MELKLKKIISRWTNNKNFIVWKYIGNNTWNIIRITWVGFHIGVDPFKVNFDWLKQASTDGFSSICPPVHLRPHFQILMVRRPNLSMRWTVWAKILVRCPHEQVDGCTVRRRPFLSEEAWTESASDRIWMWNSPLWENQIKNIKWKTLLEIWKYFNFGDFILWEWFIHLLLICQNISQSDA